jgi:D-alanyl-D-alanine carboxypeptidase/D-alanyl-D-alanine endopeptidase (penicillin-binding protein 7)
MSRQILKNLVLIGIGAAWALSGVAAELQFRSPHALVMDETTGAVLLEKGVEDAVPIASLTKLMTAMVVLDAGQDGAEEIRIDDADVDELKHTRSRLPVGSVITRDSLLELALIASDNRAAAALARTYPGGPDAFAAAVRRKIEALGLQRTTLVEPTGLSAQNRSSAHDLGIVVRAAGQYPEIARITSQPAQTVTVRAREVRFRNTNALVGRPGWNILLSKTGFTNEAGRCLTMRIETAGRTLLVVLLGASNAAHRTMDALNVQRWALGVEPVYATARPHRLARAGARATRRGHHGAVLQASRKAPSDPA